MIHNYEGHRSFGLLGCVGLSSGIVGVYYCGYLFNNSGVQTLQPLYVGRATGEAGVLGRIRDHIREDHWPDVTHFGFRRCTTAQEAINLEAQEIQSYQPKYNTQGK